MAFLEVKGLYKKEADSDAVNGISFRQQSFQKIGIAGETGSGKTTLLKMIAGLVQPDAGEVYFNHEKVLGPFDQLIPGHKGIGYLSQHFELRNNYWVDDFLEMANLVTEAEALRIYSVCEINHLLKRRTHQLSGGEKQRIALARLLTASPQLLLLDEPFSNLDVLHKQTMKQVIQNLGLEWGISCIIVSHEPADLLAWADEIMLMKDGVIVQQGSPEQVYTQPVNEYAAGLLGEYSLVDAAILQQPLVKDKQVFLRPHQFQIGLSGEHTFTGIIEAVYYRGAYSLLEVACMQQRVIIFHQDAAFRVGDSLSFSVIKSSPWYL